jgi:hypothetical protein
MMVLKELQHLDDVEKPQRPELNFRYTLRNRMDQTTYVMFPLPSEIEVITTLYFPSNAHNVKKRRVIRTFLNIRKLLQHVSVYKETIIREPQPVLS